MPQRERPDRRGKCPEFIAHLVGAERLRKLGQQPIPASKRFGAISPQEWQTLVDESKGSKKRAHALSTP
jgi:hypothetical protein